jgi:hypothetical protein
MISYDKNGKLRAKIDGKSLVVKMEYVVNSDGQQKSVTRQVKKFLKTQRGGVKLNDLPKEILDKIGSELCIKDFLNLTSTSSGVNLSLKTLKEEIFKVLLHKHANMEAELNKLWSLMFSSGQEVEIEHDELKLKIDMFVSYFKVKELLKDECQS